MLIRRDEPLPREAIRDLLGVVRALYRAEKTGSARPAELKRLEGIGRRLVYAIELAGSRPGSVGGRAAWEHAEAACKELGEVVEHFTLAMPMVEAAQAAVTGRRVDRPKKNEPWR